jgi:hypothetical protein
VRRRCWRFAGGLFVAAPEAAADERARTASADSRLQGQFGLADQYNVSASQAHAVDEIYRLLARP